MVKVLGILFKYSRVSLVLAVIAAAASGLTNTGILVLTSRVLASEDLSLDRSLVWAFAILCVLVPLTRFGSFYMLLNLSQKAVFDLRIDLCRKMLAAPLRRLEEVGAHRLMTALTGDIGSISTALMDFPLLCMNATVVIGSLVYLGWLSWQALLVVLVFLVVGIASYRLPMIWGTARQRLARVESDAIFLHFRTVTEGTKELKLHRPRRQAFLMRLEASAAAFRRLNITALSIFSAAASFGQALVFVAVGLAVLVIPGRMDVDREVVTGFALVLLYLMTPLQSILNVLPSLTQASVAVNKVEGLGFTLNTAVDNTEGSVSITPDRNWKEIELAGVTHSYFHDSDDRKFTLGPIDLKLRQGELVFVVGGNGSGKTTLMKLIAGLYTPQEGEVLVDGVAVTDQSREAYRQMFSAVFSDFYLFRDLLGLDHPELDRQARDYLQQLELAHKVKVEGGMLSTTDLSQGQRKRLALLTAYLEDRPIYLFDEWAADQDPVYKDVFYREILQGLRERGRTALVICHDDRYFHLADRVVKLENGSVVLDQANETPFQVRSLATPTPMPYGRSVAEAHRASGGAD